jgi:hypothetical protein
MKATTWLDRAERRERAGADLNFSPNDGRIIRDLQGRALGLRPALSPSYSRSAPIAVQGASVARLRSPKRWFTASRRQTDPKTAAERAAGSHRSSQRPSIRRAMAAACGSISAWRSISRWRVAGAYAKLCHIGPQNVLRLAAAWSTRAPALRAGTASAGLSWRLRGCAPGGTSSTSSKRSAHGPAATVADWQQVLPIGTLSLGWRSRKARNSAHLRAPSASPILSPRFGAAAAASWS